MPNNLLFKRGKTYGNYTNACRFRRSIIKQMNHLHKEQHGQEIPATVRVMIEDLVHKLARIAVTPHHIDSLKDIQGYAQLMINYFEEPE